MTATQFGYSLRGDRHVEYTFATDNIPVPPLHTVRHLLDIGPGPRCSLGKWAKKRGWSIIAVDILENISIPGIHWINDDLNNLSFPQGHFHLILNVSSIEHFGVPGRYGINTLDEDADLRAMDRMSGWLNYTGKMIVTLPVGNHYTVLSPYHRVYDNNRLQSIFSGYKVRVQKFWHKTDMNDNEFVPCSDEQAFSTQPTLSPHHYYAIGGFVLTHIQDIP